MRHSIAHVALVVRDDDEAIAFYYCLAPRHDGVDASA